MIDGVSLSFDTLIEKQIMVKIKVLLTQVSQSEEVVFLAQSCGLTKVDTA